MSSDRCDCERKIILLSCSGGCPEGQLANRAAVELAQEGLGEMVCLARIAAGKSGFMRSVRDASRIVIIDGCHDSCGRTLVENAGIKSVNHVIVSKLMVSKAESGQITPDDVTAVKHSVKLASGEPIRVTFHSPKPLSPGDRCKSKMLGGRCC